MKTWEKVCIFLGVLAFFIVLMMVVRQQKSEERYMLLESQAYDKVNSQYARDHQTEFCYDIGDRIALTHQIGFNAQNCASLTPHQFNFALQNVQSCELSCTNNSMDDTARRICNAACFAREFERDPIVDRTISPLIMK
jgi:hypothetical protein